MKKLIVLLFVSQFFSSCVSGAKVLKNYNEKITVEKKAVPPEIGVQDNYIVCILQSKSKGKVLKKTFPMYYNGKCVFLTDQEFKTGKYSDVNLYQYVFDSESTYYASTVAGNPGSSLIEYFVLDRKDGTKYSPNLKSNYREKYITVYAQKLEAQRLLNQKKK